MSRKPKFLKRLWTWTLKALEEALTGGLVYVSALVVSLAMSLGVTWVLLRLYLHWKPTSLAPTDHPLIVVGFWAGLFVPVKEGLSRTLRSLFDVLSPSKPPAPIAWSEGIGQTLAKRDAEDDVERTDPLVIEGTDDLEKLTVLGFLERDLFAQVMEYRRDGGGSESGAWATYQKKVLLFPSSFQDKIKPVVGESESWAIVGDPGVGKSSFMLRILDAAFSQPSTLKPWFKKVAFLHPRSDSWKRDFAKFDEEKDTTLFVVDAPFRGGREETDESKQRKAQSLRALLNGFRPRPRTEDDEPDVVGPFNVLITLRREDLAYLENQKVVKSLAMEEQEKPWTPGDLRVIPLTGRRRADRELTLRWEPNGLWRILKHYLILGDVPFSPTHLKDAEDPGQEITQSLRERSQGLPIYCEEMARYLTYAKKEFTAQALAEFPRGLAGLYCHVLEKLFSGPASEAALKLIVLLADTAQGFSEGFFYSIFDGAIPDEQKTLFRSKWEIFKSHYAAKQRTKKGDKVKHIAGRDFFRIASPHFISTIRSTAASGDDAGPPGGPHFDTMASLREKWQRRGDFLTMVSDLLYAKLATALSNAGDFLVFADLARLGDAHAEKAFELWRSEKVRNELQKLPEPNPPTVEFYEAIVDYAFRAMKLGEVKEAREWFTKAFEIQPDTKDMMKCAGFLRNAALSLTKEDNDREVLLGVVGSLYERLLQANPEDVKALTARAKLYQKTQKMDEAEADLAKAVTVTTASDQDRLSALHSYAVFERWQPSRLAPDDFQRRAEHARRMLDEGLALLESSSQINESDKTTSRLMFTRQLDALEKYARSIDWDARLLRYNALAKTNPTSWYYPAKMGLCYQHLGKGDECLRSYELAAQNTNPRWAKGFASLRNALNEAKRELELAGPIRRNFESKMLEWSKKAYELNPRDWKNCSDYCEDLLREARNERESDAPAAREKFLKAAGLALEGWQRYKQGVKSGLQSPDQEINAWARGHGELIRERVGRYVRALAEAHLGLGNLDSARRYMQMDARLENTVEGWLRLIRSEKDEIKSKRHASERCREGYLLGTFGEAVWRLGSPANMAGTDDRAQFLWAAREVFKNLGMREESAISALYSQILKLPGAAIHSGHKVEVSKECGSAGLELLNTANYEEAFLCCLNALRLNVRIHQVCSSISSPPLPRKQDNSGSEHERMRKNLAHLQEAAKDLELKPLSRFLEQIIDTVSVSANEADIEACTLEQAVLADAQGQTTASKLFYLDLACSPWSHELSGKCMGFSQILARRTAITGLIICGEWKVASQACATLDPQVRPSEQACLRSLARTLNVLAEPTTIKAAMQ